MSITTMIKANNQNSKRYRRSFLRLYPDARSPKEIQRNHLCKSLLSNLYKEKGEGLLNVGDSTDKDREDKERSSISSS